VRYAQMPWHGIEKLKARDGPLLKHDRSYDGAGLRMWVDGEPFIGIEMRPVSSMATASTLPIERHLPKEYRSKFTRPW
jgi:hypothetical protein